MLTESVAEILRDYDSLKGERGTWESHWDECASFGFPKQKGFLSKETPGEKRTIGIYDGTPIRALNKFAAILEGLLTPRNQLWHHLQPEDPTLKKSIPVKQFYDEVNEILFRARYRSQAMFASTQHETYLSLGAFGTGCKFIEDTLEGIRYSPVYLGNLFIKTNYYGKIDTVYRKMELTARQSIQRFGEDVHESIKNCTDHNKKFEFIHCVAPNEDFKKESKAADGMKYRSYYIDVKNKKMMKKGGYTSMPYITARYTVAPCEMYGRSPMMEALPDIKMLNEQRKVDIRQRHIAIDPPILAQEDIAHRYKGNIPGHIIPGALDDQGKPLIQPFQNGARIDVSDAEIQEGRKTINESFLIDVFQTIMDHPNMTATQVIEIAQQKAMLLSPAMGRLQEEDLALTIEREIDILAKSGQLPKPPDELLEAGFSYKIEYDSPLSRAQKSEEAAGILRTYEVAGMMANFAPEVLDNFDHDEAIKRVAEAYGTPNKILKEKEKVQEAREQRAQAQAMQQMAQMAPPLAQAGKDVAEIAQ